MNENVTRHHVELAEVVRNLAVAGLFDADAFGHWSTPLPDPRHADVAEVAAVLAENDGVDLVLVAGDPEFLDYLDAPALDVEALARHLVANGAGGHVADPVALGTGGLGTGGLGARWYYSEAVHRVGDPVPGALMVIAAALHGDSSSVVDDLQQREALAAFVLWAWEGGHGDAAARDCVDVATAEFESMLVELPEIVDGFRGVVARYVEMVREGWAGDAETAADFYGAESLAYGDGTDLALGDWEVVGSRVNARPEFWASSVERYGRELAARMFRRWEDDGCPGRRDPLSPDAADPEK